MLKILIICFALFGYSYAQDQSLVVGKVKLTIGSDKEAALDQFDGSYYVEEDLNDDNLFTVWDSSKRNYNYGSIKFDKAGRLVSITKFWSSAVNDSYSQIFEQLIKLIDNYTKNGDIKIETAEVFEPNYKASTLSFIQDKKKIEISLVGNRIIMQELLNDSK